MGNNKQIRVLCVFSTLDRGGAESMCMNLYRNIDRAKVQFDFVKHTKEHCSFDDEIKSLGGRIYIAPRFKGTNIIEYQGWWKDHLNKHPEHRIIHGHYFTVSKYYFSICKRMGRITIGHSHTDTYNNSNILKKMMIRGTENLCDYRLACSEKAGKLLFPHKEFTILRNAIDIEQYTYNPILAAEVRNEFNLGNSFILGTVANIKHVKNPLGLVNIFNEVMRINPDTRLLWVGRDGGMKTEVEKQVLESGLKDKIIFTGNRTDVYRILQGMDCFLLPSFSEGLPVTLIEAQAAGLTCYVSDTVTNEVNITGLCKFLPVEKETEWAQMIFEEKSCRRDTSEEIRAAGYDIHQNAAWIQAFYNKILTGE